MSAPPAYESINPSASLNAMATNLNAEPITKVQLNFKAQGLKNRDTLSKSDPCIFIYSIDQNNNEILLGQTETIKDNLNPEFAFSLVVDYKFEEEQKMKFYVVDIDGKGSKPSDHDWLGEVECTLARIVSARGGQFKASLQHGNKKNLGELLILSEELNASRETIKMILSGSGLDKKDFFGKSDPYLIFKKTKEDGSLVAVYKTETIKNTLNPKWKEISLPLQILCNADWQRPLLIECFDWDKNSDPDLIGQAHVSMNDLRSNVGKNGIPLINPKKQKKKKYSNSGLLIVNSFKVEESFTFLDYLQSGYQLNLMCAIDFTASNGKPTTANSLHYINPYAPNDYQKAIVSVGNILLEYDSDGAIYATGFGAKIPPEYKTSFCFNLSLSNQQYAMAIPGLMNYYSNAIANVKLYGPTNLAPTIMAAIQKQRASPGEYLVVLILTDGVITDVDDTVDAIVEASNLPISIVLVGVGNANFDTMEFLDADDGVLRGRNGRTARRDIVQFVEFNAFKSKPLSALSSETLAEIPGQFVAAMKQLDLKPLGK